MAGPLPHRVLFLAAVTSLLSCARAGAEVPALAGLRKPLESSLPREVLYAGGLGDDWKDYGWAPRDLGRGPARLDLSRYGGWIIAKPGLAGRFGGLVFRYRAPAAVGDFLEVRLDTPGPSVFPRVKPAASHRADLADGWSEVFISMAELNPRAAAFDRVVVRAYRAIESNQVELDQIALTVLDGSAPAGPGAVVTGRTPSSARLAVDCRAPARPISPLIYGIAFDARLDPKESHQFQLGATARRWGGNITSRYNWELGNAWNTGNDWFFRNVAFGKPGFTWEHFLADNLEKGFATALTVPTLGWVAKDRDSPAFPVSLHGKQRRTDPYHSEAGDGFTPSGAPISPGPPSRTSVAMAPGDVARWVAAIREKDRARGGVRSVEHYILDNEPALWNSTHRDVHPDPLTYDELLEKTLSYGSAVRRADPEGVIAGPAEWGWPAYFFSAADAVAGFRLKPDRRAHGDVPLLQWYLRKLAEHERQTGERILDVVDVHFYPQGDGLQHGTGGRIDPDTNARRIRATRALWDPTYVDESWIGEPVKLIPRLREWIDQEYPGRKISIGEWSFGAEQHPSGGLALAEALGRFGQQGVDSAYYWTYPAKSSFGFQAFRAYRNYDGKGARFLDYAMPTRASEGTSVFASRDASGKKLVLVVLNFDPDKPADAALELQGCGEARVTRAFSMGAEKPEARSGQGAVDRPAAPVGALLPERLRARAGPAPGRGPLKARPPPCPSPPIRCCSSTASRSATGSSPVTGTSAARSVRCCAGCARTSPCPASASGSPRSPSRCVAPA
ncbi:MAG: glycoside hydrolase family 44 protein [Myxococcales bacterium]